MDAFEVNKTVGAVLAALLVIFGSKTMLDILDKKHKPAKPGWALPITEVAATSEKARPRRSMWPKSSPCCPKPARTAARTRSRSACSATPTTRAGAL